MRFPPPRPVRMGLVLALLAVAPAVAQTPGDAPGTSCALAPGDTPAAPETTGELTVFAAASLGGAFEALRVPWSAEQPGSPLVLALDSSAALRAQIEQGAPADVFAAADTADPQSLVDACLAPGPVTAFAQNRLALIVPAGDPAGIVTFADLARPGVKVVAAGPDVPITRYASALIANLAGRPDAPPDLAAAIAANTVSEEDNVKAVVAKIELGEGDAAIVYASDAAASAGTATIPIPEEANVLATYGAVMVGDTDQPVAASLFLAFLRGPEAQAILGSHGFLPAT